MSVSEETLQQYFDGELPEAEAETVKREIDASPDSRARLESLGTLRSLITMAAEDEVANFSSDDLFAKVRQGIDAQKSKGFGEGFKVIDGDGDGVVAKPAASRARSNTWALWAAAAAAAAVLVFFFRPTTTSNGNETVVPFEPLVENTAAAKPGSEILEVDFGQSTGTVFAIEGDVGEPIAVVWINDDEETGEL